MWVMPMHVSNTLTDVSSYHARFYIIAADPVEFVRVYGADVGDGETKLAVGSPRGFPVVPPYTVPSYPAKWSMDNRTFGDWVGKYGAEGYQLFGFEPNSSDLASLPSWVEHIGGKNGGQLQHAPAFVGSDSAYCLFRQQISPVPVP